MEKTPSQRLERIYERQNIEASVLELLDELTEVLNRLFEERAFLAMDFSSHSSQPSEETVVREPEGA